MLGVEVTCSNTDRRVARATGINVFGPGTKIINLAIHDAGQGIGFWQSATDATVYGSIIYNNGYEGTGRGHGHGIYSQNDTGIKGIYDNVLFQSFGLGIQAYSAEGPLNNFDLQGNVSFNNGLVSRTGAQYNLLLGGRPVAQNPVVVNNFTYYSQALAFGRTRRDISAAVATCPSSATQPSALELNCTFHRKQPHDPAPRGTVPYTAGTPLPATTVIHRSMPDSRSSRRSCCRGQFNILL